MILTFQLLMRRRFINLKLVVVGDVNCENSFGDSDMRIEKVKLVKQTRMMTCLVRSL